MTELAIRAASIPEKIAYSDSLACADILPKQFQKKPANILWAIEYGETLNITTMAAINGIHVIEGKPGASAALTSGLVRRAGHKLRVTGNNQRATAQIVRSDDPDYTFEVTWELRRNADGNPNAEDAGLLGKQVWKNYPAAMLKARAITQVARDACEEVLFGLHYTPEELGAETDADGTPLEQRATRQYGQAADDPWQTAAPAAEAKPVEPAAEYAEEVEAPAPATPDQINAILQSLSARAVNNREQARSIISKLAGREISAPKDLTTVEADAMLAKLDEQNAAGEGRADVEPEAPAVEPKPKMASGAQLTALNTALGKIGITERNARIAWASGQVGRQLGSTKDLTHKETSDLIDTLHGNEQRNATLADQLAAAMLAAQTSDELADISEEMWKHREAGRLTEVEISRLQDQSLERENVLASDRKQAA
jgi:hypothetical protein